MSKQLTVGILEGEITDVYAGSMIAEEMQRHFPIGEVYTLMQEAQGKQWRVLQRSRRSRKQCNSIRGTFASLLPCKPEQVPEIVRMVALMRE